MKRFTLLLSLIVVSAMVCASGLAQSPFWIKVYQAGSTAQIFTSTGDILISPMYEPYGPVRSTDNGATWQSTSSTNYFNCFTKTSSGDLYAGYDGVFKSTDNGEHWNQVPTPTSFSVDLLAANAQGQVLVGRHPQDSGSGIYRLENQGTTLATLPFRISKALPFFSQILPLPDGGILVAANMATNRGYLTRDNGKRWRALLFQGIAQAGNLTFALAPNGDVYAAADTRYIGVFKTTLYRSVDHGLHWKRVSRFGDALNPFTMVTDASGYIYLSTGKGVFRSTNSGASFEAINDGLDVLAGVSVPRYAGLSPAGFLFLSTPDGVYRSSQAVGLPPATIPAIEHPEEHSVPSEFALRQNYPNPFNPATRIEFELETGALVTLKVYNALGQEVATLANHEEYSEGENELEFDGSGLSSGLYYYRITARDLENRQTVYSSVRKMMLMK